MGYFCLKTVSPHDNLHCEEIDFDPTFMEETIEKVQIFFKLVVAHELLHGTFRNKIMLSEFQVMAWQHQPLKAINRK